MMKQKTNKRFERLSSVSKKQLVLESDSVLDELKQDAVAPAGMDYFYDIARDFARGEIAKQKNELDNFQPFEAELIIPGVFHTQ